MSEHLSARPALLARRARDRSLVVRIQNHPGPARASKIDGVLRDRVVDAPDGVIQRRATCAAGDEQTQGGEEKQAVHTSYSPPDDVPASNGKIISSGFEPEVPTDGVRFPDLKPENPAWRMPTHAFRARLFWQSLSPTRRAEIARCRRFRNQPYLRPANQPDSDDLLP